MLSSQSFNAQFSAQTDFTADTGLSILPEKRGEAEIARGIEGWDDLLEYGRRSESGPRVTHQSAMQLPAFWQGVTMISGDVAKIPLEVFKRTGGTDRTVDTNHPAYSIVRWCANPDQSAFEWRRQMMTHALVWNNAYSLIERNGRGDVTALYPLLPDRTTCKVVDGQKIYQSEIDGRMEYFHAYDIWHVKGITFDGKAGLDLVKFAREEIGKILARTKFASKFFRHGGRVGGILELPASRNKKTLDRQESGFRKAYEGGDQAFKTVILRENAKFHAAQASFKDTQMVEVGVEDTKVVARLLNLPPHKLGVPGTSSHNSLEQENKSYYNSCLSHWFCSIESECWLKLFARPTRKSGKHFFEHTIAALLWAESETVSKIGSSGVLGGWLRPNEPRKWFNLNADPDGDRLLVPSGMVYAGTDPEPSEDPTDPKPTDPIPEPTDPDPDEQDDDTRSLTDAIASLIDETERRFVKRLAVHATKAAKNTSTFNTWLDRDLETDHLSVGRNMFAAACNVERAATGQSPDRAQEILKRFRGNLAAAANAGDNLIETITELRGS